MNVNRTRKAKSIRIIFLILMLLGCSYLRYTYVLNPNLSGEPPLISIEGSKRWAQHSLDLNSPADLNINQFIKGKSIILFWLMFGLLDYLLVWYWRGKRQDIHLFLVTYLGLTLISLIFLALHFLFKPDKVFFSLFSDIKNFLLTPLFTGIILIITRIYD